jgi:hypothetical protein
VKSFFPTRIYIFFLSISFPLFAQSPEEQMASVSGLLQKEGEVFVAVDRYYANLERTCTVEDLFNNSLTYRQGSVTIHFSNHTESPCERTFLRTEADYRFRLKDLDASRLRLVQKKYPLGNGNLTDGQDQWYEIHFFTQGDQPLISRKETTGEEEKLNTVRLLFKSQEGARQALSIFRKVFQELNPK